MFLYSLAMRLYHAGIFIASYFNPKAKAWIEGRKSIFQNIAEKLKNDSAKKIWFHCSSFGELEQGRPVLQELKKQFPQHKLILTFFSPSGFAQGLKESAADYVFYLPMDNVANAKKLVSLFNPSLAVFVKYDFWFSYMNELHERKIPFVYISSKFRASQYFFKWYGKSFLNKLKQATHFFVQDNDSKKLLNENGIPQVTVSGDTRFDRVKQLPLIPFADTIIEKFIANSKIIVAGSTWQQDDTLLIQYMNSSNENTKLILVPHELNETKINSIISSSKKKTERYSKTNSDEVSSAQVLIIDTIGMLSKIYRHGNIAYIGGGFGKGIHNTLEAAVYGLPVLFGPNYSKFKEANDLIQQQGAFSISNFEELKNRLDTLLASEELLGNISKQNKKFVKENAGATEKIISAIKTMAHG